MREKIEFLQKERLRVKTGVKKAGQQKEKDRYTARERIKFLLDNDSFQELGLFVKHHAHQLGMAEKEIPADGVVTGQGTIAGRRVFIYAQDFAAMGGSLGEMHARKIWKVMDLAQKAGAPLIGLNDSGGARIQEGINALAGYGGIFLRNSRNSGVIPQISVILGPCAGGAVYSPALTDFIFMVEKTSKMFITGPEVIQSVTGEDVSSEELGGGLTHNQLSGVAHFLAEDEGVCFEQIRRLLSYLPDNNLEGPPVIESTDPPARVLDKLSDKIPVQPHKPYDVKEVITCLVDHQDFFEVQPFFAANLVIGFARMAGRTIGIVANQPLVKAGCLDIDSSDKAARFIRFCDSFNIPLLTLTDVPGYLPGVDQEYRGIIRHGAKLLYAYAEATVPKINIILRKAYGGAYIAMSSAHLGADYVFAWPTAEIAVMGPEGAARIIFKKEILAADKPDQLRKEKINEYRDKFAHPYRAAAEGYVDEIILPGESRLKVIMALESILGKREETPLRKHSNMPV